MTLGITPAEARAAGKKEGEAVAADPDRARSEREHNMTWARVQYPAAAELDFEEEVLALDRERMEADLDTTKYPETAGLRECVEARREGFLSVCDDPLALAWNMTWFFFSSRRLNTRFVGTAPPPAQCTDIWITHTAEGGPIHGCNRDDVKEFYDSFDLPEPKPYDPSLDPPEWKPESVRQTGGVSSAVLCDEEPEDIFPVEMQWVMPKGVTDLREYLDILERYRDFWGPGNKIYVAPDGSAAAVEKANVRMGSRISEDGVAAITACAYLTPGMNAFKRERDLRSYAARGLDPHDNSDRAYWDGCEKRYRRLLRLVDAEASKGATLLGTANICLDHAVPTPDRICLAGERDHPDQKLVNWTLISFTSVLSGPNARSLHWVVDPKTDVPVYDTEPAYIPADGVEMRPEWRDALAAAGKIGAHFD